MGESPPRQPDDGVDSFIRADRAFAARYMELVLQAWDGRIVARSKGTEMGSVETIYNLNPEYLGDPRLAKEITKVIRIEI